MQKLTAPTSIAGVQATQDPACAGPEANAHVAPAPPDEGALHARIAQLEAELLRHRTLVAQAERLGRMGTWTLDLETNEVSWSDGTCDIFGAPHGQVMPLDRATAFYHGDARKRLETALHEAIATGNAFDLKQQHTTAQGDWRWIRSIGQLVTDERGRRCVIGFVRDITAERAANEQLRRLAGNDPVTGLCNRRTLTNRLEVILAASDAEAHRGATLIALDLDHFKAVNDLYGHDVGDEVIREVARRLLSGFRPDDTVARVGGDEFAVLLPGAWRGAECELRLQSLLRLFETPALLSVGPTPISMSVGVAIHRDGPMTAGRLLKQADLALYQAKRQGRGQGAVFHDGLQASLDQRTRLLDAVRVGLAADEFEVVYQPIVDLRTHQVRGLEALVRWRDRKRGLLAPAAFLPALTDPHLSAEIGNRVMDLSMRQMRQWLDAGVPVTCVNVNVSESQLQRGGELCDEVEELLQRHDLEPERLKVELVESAFLGDQAGTIAATIRRLSAMGVVVALDDFGTGYASLTHLKQFAIGRIKIDQSFIRDLGTDGNSAAITRAIIDLGRNLDIRVTAEGVETHEQLAFLNEASCDCAQGHLISRPLSAAEVPRFLADWYGGGSAMLGAATAAAMVPPALSG